MDEIKAFDKNYYRRCHIQTYTSRPYFIPIPPIQHLPADSTGAEYLQTVRDQLVAQCRIPKKYL